MITRTTPVDWQALQNDVSLILEQCGFDIEIEKKIKTARGEVEIDVYAEEIVKGRKYSIVCECKHWKSKVPQSIVHSFRTVINDIGANIGYIISLEGFQSGAFDASGLTNIELVTWSQFQGIFCETWLEQYLSPKITKELDPILEYTEPLVPTWFTKVPGHEIEVLRTLRDKYIPFGILMMMFTSYSVFLRSTGFPRLPIRDSVKSNAVLLAGVPSNILDAVGYREFLDACMEYGLRGISEFEAVKERNNV
jgi:hypothetical protein